MTTVTVQRCPAHLSAIDSDHRREQGRRDVRESTVETAFEWRAPKAGADFGNMACV